MFTIAAQIFIWLATTKIGRAVALVAIIGAVLLFAFLKVKAMGRREERERIEKEIERHKEIANEVDKNVGGMSDDAVDRELRKWTNDK